MGQRVNSVGELNRIGEAKGNRVLIRAIKSAQLDPKPGDLSMTRVKVR